MSSATTIDKDCILFLLYTYNMFHEDHYDEDCNFSCVDYEGTQKYINHVTEIAKQIKKQKSCNWTEHK